MGKKKQNKNISHMNNIVTQTNPSIINSQQIQSNPNIMQMSMQIIPTVSIPLDQYNALQVENIELKAKISQLNDSETKLFNIISQNNATIEELKKENEKLKQLYEELLKQNEILINKNNNLEEKLNKIIQTENVRDALSKLHDCDALSNKAFKREYKKYFNLKKYDKNVPNIGDFISDPPDDYNDQDNYKFWKEFCKEFCKNYPNSDNKNFRTIYEKINSDRVTYGAHSNIYQLPQNEFDKYLQLVIPDVYNSNKILCTEYRDWLYLFE
jgi:regulator of replication initiation timing